MPTNHVTKLATVGEVAKRLNSPPHRIAYIVKTRDIRPRAWAGNARCFDDEAIARIRYELNVIDSRRTGGDG